MEIHESEGYDEVIQKLIATLPAEQVLAAFKPEQVLAAFKPSSASLASRRSRRCWRSRTSCSAASPTTTSRACPRPSALRFARASATEPRWGRGVDYLPARYAFTALTMASASFCR